MAVEALALIGLKGDVVKKLILATAVSVFAVAAFLVFNPQKLVAQDCGAICANTGSCTVQVIATGQQFTHACVPYQYSVNGGNPCDPSYCNCPYTLATGWGYTYKIITNSCPYGPATQY